MPRVSKALSESFFAAFVGNGNIRYCPGSEPAAIVTAADRLEYLSLRIDRRELVDRPNEATYLEFPKEACIACIGCIVSIRFTHEGTGQTFYTLNPGRGGG